MTAYDWVCMVGGAWLLAAVLLAPSLGQLLRRTTAAAEPADAGLDVLGDAFDTLPLAVLPPAEQVRRLELLYRDAA
ncbi:hypothetical protein [Blastococcus sp. SYSU D00813]